MKQRWGLSSPPNSLLAWGMGQRLLIAVGLSGILWIGVYWALHPLGS